MNSDPPKIVVIGAGSAVFGLGALSTIIQHPAMRGARLALCDINAEGLAVIHQLAEIMNRAWDAELRISSSTERRELLPEADFVLVSIQVGPREEVWERDWRIPLRHGVRQPYAENGGTRLLRPYRAQPAADHGHRPRHGGTLPRRLVP